MIQGPLFAPGVRGQALFFDETNRGFLGSDVGYYDRNEPFTLDFWFYVGAEYDNVPVLNHLAENNSGRTGYRLTIQGGQPVGLARAFSAREHDRDRNARSAARRRVDAHRADVRRLAAAQPGSRCT